MIDMLKDVVEKIGNIYEQMGESSRKMKFVMTTMRNAIRERKCFDRLSRLYTE